MKRVLSMLVVLFGCTGAIRGDVGPLVVGGLARSAELGFVAADQDRLTVRSVAPDMAAAKAGLRAGDVIVAVNGEGFARPYQGSALLQRAKGRQPLTLALLRDGRPLTLSYTPPPRPLESYADVEIDYGVLRTSDGARLRSLVSRPRGAPAARLPALFFTQWVSCGSVETLRPGREQIAEVMRRSGWALIRVERAGAGDSEGPPCHELDYDTELRHYRDALAILSRHPWIDPARIVIWGSSLGSTMAPLLAQGFPVAGMIVQGGGALTYAERMIAFDRLGLERSGSSPAEIDRAMRQSVLFNAEYLLHRRTPDQILRERPDLAGVWQRMRGTGDGVHYGRPYAYHWQAADKDFLAAWSTIEAPALILYGEYDQFEPEHGHALIADTLNRLRPGSATFVRVPQAGHDLEIFPTAEAAMTGENGAPAPALFLDPVLKWLSRLASRQL
jgi:pimeloyl-ACP methyl ester carboxylesterase